MIELKPSERAYIMEMRMLSTDEEGREILVGLTPGESDFYIQYGHARIAGTGAYDPAARDRYVALYQKHEIARLRVLGAEVELRVTQPPVN